MDPIVHDGTLRRKKATKYPQVDEALMLWFNEVWTHQGNVNDAILVEKAIGFRDAFSISIKDLKLSRMA